MSGDSLLQAFSLQKLCDRGTLWAAAVLLTFPALAIGGLLYWTRAFVQLAAASLALLWSLRAFLGTSELNRARIPARTVGCGLALLALLILPLVPLPPLVVQWLSPQAFEVCARALPGWPDRGPFADLFAALQVPLASFHLGSVLAPASWRPLSLVPYDSRMTLVTGTSYAVLGAVVACYPWQHELRALVWLVRAVIALAVFQTLYALVQQSTAGGRILWLQCPPHSTCTGTYLNRNHYAGLLEMAFPLLVARARAAWASRRRGQTERRALGGTMRELAHLLGQLSQPAAARAVSLWCLALLLFAALASSASRSAFAATLASFAITTMPRGRTGTARARAVTVAALATGAGLWLLFPQFTARLGTGDIARAAIAADTLDMIEAFPLFGVGVGNFGSVFPLYRGRTIESWAFGVDVDHAHNDYLEWVAEAGLPAAGVAFALLIGFARRVALLRRDHAMTEASLLRWGFATGTLALLLHSLTDFNLHIPANALVFTFLVGGLIRLTRRETKHNDRPTSFTTQGPFRHRTIPALAALVLSVGWGAGIWHRWSAEAAFRRVYPDSQLRNLMHAREDPVGADALALVQQAAAQLPAAPSVQLGLARQFETTGGHASSAAPDRALTAFVRSLWAAPLQPRALLELVTAANRRGATASEDGQEVLRDLMDRVATLAPYDPPLRLEVADWYIGRWDSLPPAAREHAAQTVDAALDLAARAPGFGSRRRVTSEAYDRIVAATARAGHREDLGRP